jgi:hypothetical protein
MNNTVVFILSANYSGSTWLALLLGSHSRAAYVGELNKMFHDNPVSCRLCEEKGRVCPIFYDAAETKAKNIHHLVLARTGKKVVVDNSKTVSWSKKFLAENRFERKYIHLLRDPRAIAYSRQMRHRPAELEDWIDKNYEIRSFLLDNQLDRRVITYNELAENTGQILTHLCQWLGLVYEPGQEEYWNFEHHGPGRNGATAAFLDHHVASDEQFYADTKRKHFHDLRWKENLAVATQEAIVKDARLQTCLKDFQLQFAENGLARRE